MTTDSQCRFCGKIAGHNEACPEICPANLEEWQRGSRSGMRDEYFGCGWALGYKSAAFRLGYWIAQDFLAESLRVYEEQEARRREY